MYCMVNLKINHMKHHTIQKLKHKLNQAKPGCCFTARELFLLRSLFPRQDYIVKERIMITCALPVRLIELAKALVQSKEIESVSFLFRIGLESYRKTGWVPPLSELLPWTSPKVDYSFRVEKETLQVWQNIKDNKVKVLESWGWFLGRMYVEKLV